MRFPIIAAALVAASPAWAQLCDDENGTLQARSKLIGEVAGTLATNMAKIETVPPDTAAYIDREKDAAMKQHNRARFNLVLNNPFYKAHQVQTHYKVVQENLEAARTAKKVADQIVYLSVVISRYGDLAEALSAYYDYDASRPQRVLGSEGIQDVSFAVAFSKSAFLETLQCGVRQMREP